MPPVAPDPISRRTGPRTGGRGGRTGGRTDAARTRQGNRPGQNQTPAWYQQGRRTPSAIPASQYGMTAAEREHANQMAEYAALRSAGDWIDSQMGPESTDPFGGQNIYDLMNFGPGSGGSGGGGRGGGGGAAAASAATQAAYQQMLAALTAKSAADQAGFNTRQGSINDLAAQGGTRLQGILAGLNAGAAQTRQAVQDSYARSDAVQAQLQQQFAAQEAARAQGAGQTLGMFGGAPGAIDRQYGASDMLNAQRGMMAGVQGANDRMWAARPDVYNGLFADASTNNSTMQQQLLQQIAVARQQAQAQAASEQAQLAIQAAGAGVKL